MYNGIGLQTARGSGTNGYIQTNKFFIKPKTNKLTSKSSYEGGQEGSGGRGPNKEILEHDRKREIELKLAVLEDKLIEQGYTDDEIAVKLHEARNTLQSADTVLVLNPHHNHHHKYSDTQSHQVAARKEKQMEKLKNALGIKVHEDDAKNAKIDDDGDNKAENTCKKTDGGFDDGKLEKAGKDGYKKKTKKRRESSDSSDSDNSDSSRRENVQVSNKKKSRGRSDTESSDSDVDIRKNRKKLSSKHKSKSDTKKHVKRYHQSDSDGNSSSDGSLDIKDNDSDSDVDKYHRTRQLEDKMRKEKRKVEKDISSTRNDYGRGGINDRWDGGSSSKRDTGPVRGGTTHGKGRRHDDTDDEDDDIHHKKEEVERRRHGRRDSTEVIIDKRLKKERETGRNEEDSSDRKDIKSGETRHHIEDQRKTERDNNVERDGRKRHDVDLEPFDKNEDDKYLEGRKENRDEEDRRRGRKHKRDEDDEKPPEKSKYSSREHDEERERRRGDRDDRYAADNSKRTRYDGGRRSRH